MVPILINKDVFEPSYNDLKFMVWNQKYICTNLNVLEKAMATHSSILAWRIPGTEEPGGTWLKQLSSSSNLILATLTIWETLQCPESRYKQNPDHFLIFCFNVFPWRKYLFFFFSLLANQNSLFKHESLLPRSLPRYPFLTSGSNEMFLCALSANIYSSHHVVL